MAENNSTATSTAGVTKRVSNLPIRQQLSAARSILSRSPSTVHPSPPTNSEKLDRQHPGQTSPRSRSFFHSPRSPNSATVAPAQDVAGRTPLPPSRPLPRFGLPISPKKIAKAINSTFDRRSSPVHPAPATPIRSDTEAQPPVSEVPGSGGAEEEGRNRPPRPDNWETMSKNQKKHWKHQGGKARLRPRSSEGSHMGALVGLGSASSTTTGATPHQPDRQPTPDPDPQTTDPHPRGGGHVAPPSETQQPLRGGGIRPPPHPTNPIRVALGRALPLGGGVASPGAL